MPKLWGRWLKTAESTQVEREVAEDGREKRRKKEKRGLGKGYCGGGVRKTLNQSGHTTVVDDSKRCTRNLIKPVRKYTDGERTFT